MAVSRRSFLKGAAAITATTAASGTIKTAMGEPAVVTSSSTPNKWRGRVAINFNKDVVTTYSTKKWDSTILKKMVNDTVMLLAGKTAIGDAWKEIFPSTISATSKIAIKTNFYSLNLSPPPDALLAMVEGLRAMEFSGSKFTGAITIYEGNTSNDFTKAGYDSAAFTALNATLTKASMKTGSNAATGETSYASLLDEVDFLINVFTARGHDPFTEGFSLGFKNHYGSYPATGNLLHQTGGFSQRVRNLHCTGVISKKQVLSVNYALFCNDEGTSMGNGNPNRSTFTTYAKTMDPTATCESPSTIIMSTDAISCDMQVIKLLRLNKGKTFAPADMPKYLRASAGVTGALSDKTYDIGEIDEAKMEIRKMINGNSTPVITGAKSSAGSSIALLQATPLRGQGSTHFEFRLPATKVGMTANLSVVDLQGRQVYSKELPVNGALNHFSWDQRTSSGANVAGGRYVATIKAGALARSAQFILQ